MSMLKDLIDSNWDLGRIAGDIDEGMRNVILCHIPASISPNEYPSHLLVEGGSSVCYEQLAGRMASTGYHSNAKLLLESTNLTDHPLYVELCQFAIIHEQDQDGIHWIDFHQDGLTGYLAISPNRDQIVRRLLAEGLFVNVNDLMNNIAGTPKVKLHSCLEDRLNRHCFSRSLRDELTELSEKGDTAKLGLLIDRTLELLVMRRDMGRLDLDTFLVFRAYTEFGGEEEPRDELESYCFQLLESLA